MTLEAFDRICAALVERGAGLALLEMGHAWRLAQELHAKDPDPERIDELRDALGLTQAQLEATR